MDPNSRLLMLGSGGSAPVDPVYVEDVFSTYLYVGNGSTQTITNGIDLAGEGGLVWIKGRAGYNNVLADTVRGAGNRLFSDNTDANNTSSTSVTAFTSSGFSLGSNVAQNAGGQTYASWTFRKAPGFFDVVTYTGNGVAGRTVAHSLGSVPGCIVVKNTTTGGTYWSVYHRSLGATKRLYLNTTTAAASGAGDWASTEPTSSVFSVGIQAEVNTSGDNYVAYLFAHDAGGFGDSGNESIISCGSYTGTAPGNFATVNLGWEPEFVITKMHNGSSDWNIHDTIREASATGYKDLIANSSRAEEDKNYPTVRPFATGFDVVWGNNGSNSGSSNQYIYIAIRRGPMKAPVDATKVFQTLIYTGDGTTTRKLTTGIKSDLFTVKLRDTSSNGWTSFVDRKRGKRPEWRSTSNGAEISFDFFTDFDHNNGVEIYNVNQYNSTGQALISYHFGRAPGFFDIVTYTGTGATLQVPHGLGVAPEFMMIKRRNDVESCQVYVVPISPTASLELEKTAGAGFSGRWDGASTATQIRLSTHASVNASGSTYLAYLFATVPGVSKVGSYTGTGSTLNIDCGFTNGVRFLLIKRTDNSGNWYVWDSSRGIVAGNDPYYLLNVTDAQNTSTDYIDPLSSGFQISQSAPAEINGSGGTFIFLAIA